MHRPIVPLAIVLALVTGMVLAETRRVLVTPIVAGANTRTDGNRIAEQWGDPAGAASFDVLLTTDVSIPETTDEAVTLERWTFAPETTSTRLSGPGFVVLVVAAGTPTVQITPRQNNAVPVPDGKQGTAGSRRWAPPGDPIALKTGDGVSVPAGSRVTIRNDGAIPAVVFAVGTGAGFSAGGDSPLRIVLVRTAPAIAGGVSAARS